VLLDATPLAVFREILPEPVAAGTTIVMLLDVTAVGVDTAVKLSFTRSFAGTESKFVPLRLTDVPAATICGLNEAICGIPVDEATVNELALVTEP
jgi:hypothetical protein